MVIDIWLVYVGTILILMSTPGPSHLLMLSNSISNGFYRSIFTAAGDLTANLIQMIVASIGLVGVITSSQGFFIGIKWAGVLYLVYLGLRRILSKSGGQSHLKKQRQSNQTLYWQGFITSMANPKAVIFFAALFPQFINPEQELFGQFLILSATYLIIDATFLCSYGKFAEWVSVKVAPGASRSLNNISGALLIIAAILLGLRDIEPQ